MLDLYWDQSRAVWSLCPVAIPPQVTASSLPSTATVDASSIVINGTSTLPSNSTQNATLTARQISDVDQSRTLLPTLASTASNILDNALPTISSMPETPDAATIRIGPYSCSPTLTLTSFTSLIYNYIKKTETTINATLIYMIFNIHAASTFDAPTSPAPQQSRLPASAEYVGNIISSALSNYIYDNVQLIAERENLNASWYVTNPQYRPVEVYYNTAISPDGIVSTTDGWPSESYLEFQQSQRLLLGWGTVDPQMSAYNFTADSGVIFDNGFIANTQQNVTATSNGNVTGGCFLRNTGLDVANANNSWAVSYTIPNFQYPTTSSASMFFFRVSHLRKCLDLVSNLQV